MLGSALEYRGRLSEPDFRPQFSGHETFPLRYGWLKKVFDAVYAVEVDGDGQNAKDVFLDHSSIARFGVGKNMVTSMRHWAVACNVIQEDSRGDIATTDLGKLLFRNDSGVDPWMENSSSLWLLHWNIATVSSKASYLWFFGYFSDYKFDRNTITDQLLQLCWRKGWKGSQATIKRDVECLVRTYAVKASKTDVFTEEQIESPLTELGLLQSVNRNETFQINRGLKPSLGNGVFLYALVDFWKHYSNAETLNLEPITYEPMSPGRVFCLDDNAVADRLYNLERSSDGLFAWTETSGLRQVVARKPLVEIDAVKDLLLKDYDSDR